MGLVKSDNAVLKRESICVSYICEQGGRTVNEDSIEICKSQDEIFVAVADGLGAHGGGDIASSMAVKIARDSFIQLNKPTERKIYNIFKQVNEEILKKQTEKIEMKTTLACMMLKGKQLYAAHLGDTRIYLFSTDGSIYVSDDHSVAFEAMSESENGDVRKNINRHILTAALGIKKIRSPDIVIRRIRKIKGILICSDGFWEYVTENDMVSSLFETRSSDEWLRKMLLLHSENSDKDICDNYSAICLKII